MEPEFDREACGPKWTSLAPWSGSVQGPIGCVNLGRAVCALLGLNKLVEKKRTVVLTLGMGSTIISSGSVKFHEDRIQTTGLAVCQSF